MFDDRAAPALHHPRDERLGEEVGRPQVEREGLLEDLGVLADGRGDRGHSGVVDEHVDVAGLGGQVVELVEVGQVGGDEPGGPSVLDDLVDDHGALAGVAAGDDHVVALGAEHAGALGADSVGRAGDEYRSHDET